MVKRAFWLSRIEKLWEHRPIIWLSGIRRLLSKRSGEAHTIECKLSEKDFSPAAMAAFRQSYKAGLNYVVCRDVEKTFTRIYGAIAVRFVDLEALIAEVAV